MSVSQPICIHRAYWDVFIRGKGGPNFNRGGRKGLRLGGGGLARRPLGGEPRSYRGRQLLYTKAQAVIVRNGRGRCDGIPAKLRYSAGRSVKTKAKLAGGRPRNYRRPPQLFGFIVLRLYQEIRISSTRRPLMKYCCHRRRGRRLPPPLFHYYFRFPDRPARPRAN